MESDWQTPATQPPGAIEIPRREYLGCTNEIENRSHLYYSFADDKPDERVEIAQSYESLAKIFDEFRELPGLGDVYLQAFSSASAHFRSESSSFHEDTPDDSGPDDEHYSGGNDRGLDVDDLFHDL